MARIDIATQNQESYKIPTEEVLEVENVMRLENLSNQEIHYTQILADGDKHHILKAKEKIEWATPQVLDLGTRFYFMNRYVSMSHELFSPIGAMAGAGASDEAETTEETEEVEEMITTAITTKIDDNGTITIDSTASTTALNANADPIVTGGASGKFSIVANITTPAPTAVDEGTPLTIVVDAGVSISGDIVQKEGADGWDSKAYADEPLEVGKVYTYEVMDGGDANSLMIGADRTKSQANKSYSVGDIMFYAIGTYYAGIYYNGGRIAQSRIELGEGERFGFVVNRDRTLTAIKIATNGTVQLGGTSSVPMEEISYLQIAFNKGHIKDVRVHNITGTQTSVVRVFGGASEALTDADTARFEAVGVKVDNGSTYSKLILENVIDGSFNVEYLKTDAVSSV